MTNNEKITYKKNNLQLIRVFIVIYAYILITNCGTINPNNWGLKGHKR